MKFGKLSNFKPDGQNVLLDFEGKKASIHVITSQIIHVFCALDTKKYHSKAVEGDKTVPVSLNIEEKDDGLWIHTGDVSVRVSDGFYVDFFDPDGREVCMDYRGDRKPLQVISEEHRKLLASEGHDFTAHEEAHAFDIMKKNAGQRTFLWIR